MAIWKQMEKQTDMDSSSKKTIASSQTWNPEKPRETKPSLHPVNSLLFFLLYFSPHILFCFGTNWKTSLDYDFIMEEAWYKRPTENTGMPKLVIKSISITSSIFFGGGGQGWDQTSDSKQTFFLDSAFLSRLQSHKSHWPFAAERQTETWEVKGLVIIVRTQIQSQVCLAIAAELVCPDFSLIQTLAPARMYQVCFFFFLCKKQETKDTSDIHCWTAGTNVF